MDKINQFFTAFIAVEFETAKRNRIPDIMLYNESLKLMDSFLIDSLKTRFDMHYLAEPESAEYYERAQIMAPLKARHLFRIDTINHVKMGNIYRAFVSNRSSKKKYFDCLIAKPTDENFIIFSRFTFGFGRDGSTIKHWYNSGGEEMEYADLNPVTETLRLLAPDDDEESMKMYLA